MIYVGSDHMGYPLKAAVVEFLKQKGYEIIDVGTSAGEKGHYPVYAELVARAVQDKKCEKGLLFCGSGEGVNMVANKFSGIRSAWCNTIEAARLSREHNNANVLAMGTDFLSVEKACEIADIWLNTAFLAGRHLLKLKLIEHIEKEGSCLPYGEYS